MKTRLYVGVVCSVKIDSGRPAAIELFLLLWATQPGACVFPLVTNRLPELETNKIEKTSCFALAIL